MTTRIETRLQRLEATTAERAARESHRAVLARLQAVEAQRELTPEELQEQLGAVINLCGGTWADVVKVAGAHSSGPLIETKE